jgi:hypothetical protein
MKSALIVCLLWFCTTSGHAMGADSAFWKWSPYIASGVGLPNGLRTEVGMHFDTYGSVAITHGLYTTWARESTRPMFGLNARVFVPGGIPFHPYLAVGGGGTIEVFGGAAEQALNVEVSGDEFGNLGIVESFFLESIEELLIFFIQKVSDFFHDRNRVGLLFWVLPQINKELEELVDIG